MLCNLTSLLFDLQTSVRGQNWVEFYQESNDHGPRHITHLVAHLLDEIANERLKILTSLLFDLQTSVRGCWPVALAQIWALEDIYQYHWNWNWNFLEKEEDTSPLLRNEVDINIDVDINEEGEVRTYPLRSKYRGRKLFVSSEGAEGSSSFYNNNNEEEDKDDGFDDEWRGGFFKYTPKMATDGFGFLATTDRSIHTVSTSSSDGGSMITQPGDIGKKGKEVSLHVTDVQEKCFRRI